MVVFITALVESIHYIKKNWKYIPLVALFDLLFFVFFGISASFFNTLSAGPLKSIIEAGSRLTTQISLAVSQGQSPLDVFLADPSVSLSVKSIAFALLFFILLVYVFWAIFGGATWFLSNKMIDNKGLFKNLTFITKFSLVSMIWFIFYSVILTFILRFIGVALLRPDQLVSSNMILSGVSTMNYVLLYFVFLSMSLVPFTSIKENFKQTFTKAFTKIHVLIPMYALILLVLYVNFKLTFLLFEPLLTSFSALAIFVTIIRFLLAAPFLVWARMYAMLVAKRISK